MKAFYLATAIALLAIFGNQSKAFANAEYCIETAQTESYAPKSYNISMRALETIVSTDKSDLKKILREKCEKTCRGDFKSTRFNIDCRYFRESQGEQLHHHAIHVCLGSLTAYCAN